MNTTVYKANAIINSALNLKYHVFISPNQNEKTVDMLFPAYANLSQSFQFKIISYNGTCAKASTGNSGGVLTLVDTTVVGDDTIYTYTYKTPSNTYPMAKVQFASSCTKMLIEDIEDMVVYPYTDTLLCSLDSAKLHANKTTVPRPLQTGQSTVYGILKNTFYVREPEKAFTLDDIADIVPYYNTIMLAGCTNFECDIADLVSLICTTQEYTSPKDPAYSSVRIVLNNTGAYGKLSEAYNALKERREYKWGCQIIFGGSRIINDFGSATNAQSCFCDALGNLVPCAGVQDLQAHIPDE